MLTLALAPYLLTDETVTSGNRLHSAGQTLKFPYLNVKFNDTTSEIRSVVCV
jgi:hypothetical protein